MTYAEASHWLFEQLPMFQLQGKTAFKPGLERIEKLCETLKNPQDSFPSIHIGGTNGKGSVSHMLASVLQAHGLKTGLYTSPHLVDFRERIRVNGNMIPEESVVEFVSHIRTIDLQDQPSFFEIGVAMAFDYFAKEKVDVAIIEVGMGGRLDATNIIKPILAAITNISLDHTQYLGNTRVLIAAEKAGIAKYNTALVIGEYDEEILPVFERMCLEKGAHLHKADTDTPNTWKTDLGGDYQKHNLRTLARILKLLPFDIQEGTIKNALMEVKRQTGLRGRWEILGHNPLIIADIAHNESGIQNISKQLHSLAVQKIHFVIGVVADKDLETIIPLLPKKAKYYCCAPDIPRALEPSKLFEKLKNQGFEAELFSTVDSAFHTAWMEAKSKDCVFIGGSTFTVGEFIKNKYLPKTKTFRTFHEIDTKTT
jgi:dihydrofolate synthase/folylpolyglutamate synthase